MKIKKYLTCHHLVYHDMIWMEEPFETFQEPVSPGFFLFCFTYPLVRCTVYLPFRTVVFLACDSHDIWRTQLVNHITETNPRVEGFLTNIFPKLIHLKCRSFFLWRLFEVIMEFTLTKLFLFLFWRRRLSVESWGKSESVRGLRPSFDWVKGHDRCTICNPTFCEYTIYLHYIFSEQSTIIDNHQEVRKKTFTALNQAGSALESTSLKTRQAVFSHPILYAPKTFSHDEFRAPTHTNWRHVVFRNDFHLGLREIILGFTPMILCGMLQTKTPAYCEGVRSSIIKPPRFGGLSAFRYINCIQIYPEIMKLEHRTSNP